MNSSEAKTFFEEFVGKPSTSFFELPQSGSARMNFIGETSQEKFVITYNENLLENEAFFYFSEVFENLKLNTPKNFKIIMVASSKMKLLLEENEIEYELVSSTN